MEGGPPPPHHPAAPEHNAIAECVYQLNIASMALIQDPSSAAQHLEAAVGQLELLACTFTGWDDCAEHKLLSVRRRGVGNRETQAGVRVRGPALSAGRQAGAGRARRQHVSTYAPAQPVYARGRGGGVRLLYATTAHVRRRQPAQAGSALVAARLHAHSAARQAHTVVRACMQPP